MTQIMKGEFNHIGYQLPYDNLPHQYTKQGRIYTSPAGAKLMSVTTVLSILSRDFIREWKARIGEDEAAKISSRASGRGTAVHSLIEDYVNNKEVDVSSTMPFVLSPFKQIAGVCDTHVQDVRGLEIPLYSSHLCLAGRTDLVANFDGKLSIIDFKTSAKTKKKEWLDGYFMQQCAYAIMWEEVTKEPITRLVTIIANDSGIPQIFIQKRDRWVDPLFDTIERYANEQSS